MGLQAVYIAISDEELKKLEERERKNPDSPEDDLVEKLEELQESDNCRLLDIGKIWDGLHFVLTGISASEPIDNNELSEFIVGMSPILYEDEFVSFSLKEDVNRISEKLNQVDFDNYYENFNPEKLNSKEIYPDIWVKEEKNELFKELKENFEALKEFYNTNKKSHLFVTIY